MKKLLSLILILTLTVISVASCSMLGDLDDLFGDISGPQDAPEDPKDPADPTPETPDDPTPETPEDPDPETPDDPDPEVPEDPDPETPEDPTPEESEVSVTVKKTATELAASLGFDTNGDVVSGEAIAMDSNISVEFAKGSANTEPALYYEVIRVYQGGGIVKVTTKNGSKIEKIVITTDSEKDGAGKLSVTNGSAPVQNGDDLTITANENATAVSITVGGSNKTDRLYVKAIEVTYTTLESNAPDTPDAGDHVYTDFTADEKATYNEYVGFVVPFLPTEQYQVLPYSEDGYVGVYYWALCDTEAEFDAYLDRFSGYTYNGTETDSEGYLYYCYEKNGIYVDVCYYEYEGAYYVDVDAYYEDSTSGGGSGDSGDGSYTYYDFTAEEKATYNEYIGFVIPFLPTDDYEIEAYNENGYKGVYYSALCDEDISLSMYLAYYSSYSNDGTELDDDGDTWYLYSKNGIYVDVCYYEWNGSYYIDVDAYYEATSGGDTPDTPDTPVVTPDTDLPTDDGDGVYDVDFTDATNVKDVTDQGYYLDGCPTTGSPAVLVIPVDFSDITASSKGYSIDKIKNAFMKDGVTDYYSVYDYYYISSYGQLTLDITVLDTWFRPSKTSSYYERQTMNYYGTRTEIGDQMILDEALAYLSTIMDLSRFDSDNNGIIDSVVLITTLDIDPNTNFHWAYRYWNIYTDSNDSYYEYDGVSANDYMWASYAFLQESYDNRGNIIYTDTTVMNTYTYIHEFGHVLGADDYYDTSGKSSPMNDFDVMDSMLGDHNAFTKFNYGWLTTSRLVVTSGSVTLTLEDFSRNGDTIILANKWDPTLGAYQEYYVIVYYTNNGLNAGEDAGYFDTNGIVVYHVNATLTSENYDGEIYYDVKNNNTHSSDSYGTVDNLIEIVKVGGKWILGAGSSLGIVTDDNGDALGYNFTVNSLGASSASITFTKNA